MPTQEEFEASVSHLVRSGFINASADGFDATPSGAALFDSLRGEGIILLMLKLMDTWDGKEVPDLDSGYAFSLPRGAWEVAQKASYEAFLAWMADDKERRESGPSD
jgi:hypothetical protein